MADMTRKSFLTAVAATAALLWLKPLELFGADPLKKKAIAVPLSSLPELATPGGGTIVKLKDQPVMLIRVDDKTVAAYKPVCTHAQCPVEYKAADKKIHCNCHNADFDLTGKPIFGPPDKPLESYKAIIRDDKILVIL